ncbi:MAG TPA: hypothetical protein VFU99_13040 [Gaiellaceae bacterium]|nr:hypothetical protein [Gaiellaceae bacterium]
MKMKIKLLLTGTVAAAVIASSAVAAPPADKGKPPSTGPGCKPRIAVILKGTLAGAPGANAISVKVSSANRWGRAYVGGADKSIGVTADTKIRRQGKKTLADLKAGDRVLVQARVCKADLAGNATPALTATKVIAHPPGAKDDDDD